MKKILSIVVCLLCIWPLSAQTYDRINPDTIMGLRHYEGGDNWFITFQGGANMSLGENIRLRNISDALGWSAGLSLGKYFSPQVGARLQAAYLSQHGMANGEARRAYPQYYGDGVYDFNNIQGYVDLLLNLNNIFAQYKESTRFNVVALFGLGVNYVNGFDKDQLKRWASLTDGRYIIHTKDAAYLAVRAGFQFNVQLSNVWDLGLELTMNATNDKYNGVEFDSKYDGYANAMLGLTYHFKDHFGDRRMKYRSLNDYDEWAALNNRINEARGELIDIRPENQIVTVQERYLDMTISFLLDKSDISDVQKKNVEAVANYIKSRDDINVVVTGYADVETGNPRYNLDLSQRRAQSVYDMLVNDYGVAPSRLSMDYKGDSIQPYMLKNEWNRVVVFQIVPRQ